VLYHSTYITCGSPGATNRVGFDRRGPGGEPGDAGAGALFAAHEQIVDFRLLHDARQRRAAPRHLGIGEAADTPPRGIAASLASQGSADRALRRGAGFFFQRALRKSNPDGVQAGSEAPLRMSRCAPVGQRRITGRASETLALRPGLDCAKAAERKPRARAPQCRSAEP